MTPERFEELMVRVADGTCSKLEREELLAWVADKPELQLELEQHQALKAVTDGWMARLEADLLAHRSEGRSSQRWIEGIGTSLILVGILVLYMGGLLPVFTEEDVPVWVRVGSGMAIGGTALVLVHMIRKRLSERAHDPYTKVIR